MTSRDRWLTGTDPEATLFTGSQLEVDVAGKNPRDTVSFTFYEAVNYTSSETKSTMKSSTSCVHVMQTVCLFLPDS